MSLDKVTAAFNDLSKDIDELVAAANRAAYALHSQGADGEKDCQAGLDDTYRALGLARWRLVRMRVCKHNAKKGET